jgi:hypothetical protein
MVKGIRKIIEGMRKQEGKWVENANYDCAFTNTIK